MGYHVGSTTTTINVDGGGGGAGNYVAVFDPIDGSKNIDASLPVGTIFGIYRCPEGGVAAVLAEGEEGQRGRGWNIDSFLQRGTKLVAAGYCLYSATTVLVLTLGSGVHGFTLDPDRQTFLQTHPNMRIPDVGSLYSFNEANSRDYSVPVKEFLKTMKETGKMG
jgi:fructose-1,6-bisphosphatase I